MGIYNSLFKTLQKNNKRKSLFVTGDQEGYYTPRNQEVRNDVFETSKNYITVIVFIDNF